MTKKKIKYTEKKGTKDKKLEIRLSPSKWARKFQLDETLFEWWDNKGELISEKQFKTIKKQIYGE